MKPIVKTKLKEFEEKIMVRPPFHPYIFVDVDFVQIFVEDCRQKAKSWQRYIFFNYISTGGEGRQKLYLRLI